MKTLTTAAFSAALVLFGCSAESQYEAAVDDVQDERQDVLDERNEAMNEVSGEVDEAGNEVAGEIEEGREEVGDEMEDLAEAKQDLAEERADLAEERAEERSAAKINSDAVENETVNPEGDADSIEEVEVD